MKQSAAKTLGVAALGAAFAAAGAGSASAAPAVVPDAGSVLETARLASTALPAEQVTQALPAGEKEKPAEQSAVLMPVPSPAFAGWAVATGLTAPVAGLLGGLPVQAVPVMAVPVG
ncbi:ATP-binding protein [Streptomyces sp. NPDC051954]|uniref:ATP-binding protein n=1 Tax=unclassified Streptomyces TaxID=2593676 RepID=UPI00343A1ACF